MQRCGDADSAVMHGVAHKGLHLLELRGRGLDFVVSEDHAPHLRGADIGPQIDAHALLFQASKVLPQRAPVGRELQVVVRELVGLDDGVVERRGRAAFSGELGGDALKDL